MTRKLNRAVVLGGVVYPVGTAETPELAERVTNPDAWDGASSEAEEPAADESEKKTTRKRTSSKKS